MEKKTLEEYDAVADLLGREYLPKAHVFTSPYDYSKTRHLDADTLEPVSREEREERYDMKYGDSRRADESS